MFRPSVLLLAIAFGSVAFAQTSRADVLKAIAEETRAIEANPADADAYFKRAVAYESAGRDLEAVEDLSAFIKLNRKSSAAFERRATLYFRMGEFARADSDYAAAVFLDHRNAAALYGRGVTQRLDRFNPAGAADQNIAAATAIQPDIAEKMAARGVK
jgi:tetratricopeptide (TPR) repeat protein